MVQHDKVPVPPAGGTATQTAEEKKWGRIMDVLGEPDKPIQSSGPRIHDDDAHPTDFLNIDDPNFEESNWRADPMVLELAELDEGPKDCEDTCAEKMKKRAENCSLLRKRVAQALKEAGCPSKVIPYKTQKSKCSGGSAKKAFTASGYVKQKRWREVLHSCLISFFSFLYFFTGVALSLLDEGGGSLFVVIVFYLRNIY